MTSTPVYLGSRIASFLLSMVILAAFASLPGLGPTTLIV